MQQTARSHHVIASIIALWSCMALSAESTDANSQRRSKEFEEKLGREPPLSRQGVSAYVASIQGAIERRLVYPSGSGGKRCMASVTQDKSGHVLQIELSECQSGPFAAAVQDAIRAASPLPLPSDMRYFQRNLRLVFVVPAGR